jgi:hypothetical protein
MNEEQLRKLIISVLGSMNEEPKPIDRKLGREWEDEYPDEPVDLPRCHDLLLSPDPNHPVRLRFGNLLRKWDNSLDGDWIGETNRNTAARRLRIHELLQLDEAFRARVDEVIPYCRIGEPVVISDLQLDWYHPEQLEEDSPRNFYWNAYSRYLRERKGWSEESVLAMDNSTREIISRLGNPEDTRQAFRSRGLVMGYVQSGKTANFTGVIAKAVDAGYRLVIVLAGTWNMLRNQTQRRIDKELVGKELLDGVQDYAARPDDWDEFIEHTQLPSELGAFDCERLTGARDFRNLGDAIGALKFPIADRTQPFNHPNNLHHAPFRIIVIKKIPSRLKQLNMNLNAIRERLRDVPTLVIDDESDQAGINTLRPQTNRQIVRRTGTNKAIVKLLELLPRGQYIGYTATPYANFLVDPTDEQDLFPRHFILPLERPDGYMGISDFFDPDVVSDDIPDGDFTYKEAAFVRDGHDSDLPEYEDSMKRAIASYVLAGTVKLYRQQHGEPPLPRFRHHTMLVHSSHTNVAHSDDRQNVQRIYDATAFRSPGTRAYLENLWETDFLPVINAQGASGAVPPDFDALYDYVGPALDKIELGGMIRVLNSSEGGDEAPDFNRDDVWQIIIGGNKLSRGYTIEGLTISYYLRKSAAADTLMQMGRWFGFRKGYRDLVRIFIGRSQGALGVDLVDSFKQACLMEERSREDIRRYARRADGRPLRPIDVPPLIAISGNLPPTARNKMWNSVIRAKNFADQWFMPTRMPNRDQAMNANDALAAALWNGSTDLGLMQLGGTYENGTTSNWPAYVRECLLPDFIGFLESFKWLGDEAPTDLHLQIDFLREQAHGITSCLLIAPQMATGSAEHWHGMTVKNRKRTETGRFQLFGEPLYRMAAEYLTGRSERENSANPLETPNAVTVGLKDNKRLVCLLYPVIPPPNTGETIITIGFEVLYPGNDLDKGLHITTQVPNNDPVVDLDDDDDAAETAHGNPETGNDQDESGDGTSPDPVDSNDTGDVLGAAARASDDGPKPQPVTIRMENAQPVYRWTRLRFHRTRWEEFSEPHTQERVAIGEIRNHGTHRPPIVVFATWRNKLDGERVKLTTEKIPQEKQEAIAALIRRIEADPEKARMDLDVSPVVEGAHSHGINVRLTSGIKTMDDQTKTLLNWERDALFIQGGLLGEIAKLLGDEGPMVPLAVMG